MRPDDDAFPVSIRLLGPFEVRLNGEPLPRFRFRKSQAVLALLALRRGGAVEREWLAGLLWPDSGPSSALHSLRKCLTDLRHTLGPEAGRLRSPTSRTLCLDLTGAFVDVLAFDDAMARGAGEERLGRAADSDGGRAPGEALEEAVSLYRGALLEGCGEPWALEERGVREQAFLHAIEKLGSQALAAGDARSAEAYFRRAVAADPFREAAQRDLMEALAAGGSYAAALMAYRELRLFLHREVNAQPDAETRALFEQIRARARHRAALPRRIGEAEEAEGGEGGEGARRLVRPPHPLHPLHPSTAEQPPAAGEGPATSVLLDALSCGPMVGREPELVALRRRVDAALLGCGATVLLAGEPGIGKTRLAMEASAYARLRGCTVLAGRSDEEGAAPYQPFVEALREYLDTAESGHVEAALPPPVACELICIAPQIAGEVKDVPLVPPMPAEEARHALAEAMRQFLAAVTSHDAPVLLFLDDLHWADEGSRFLLHALARYARSMPLLIVGAYRDVELGTGHPLERTLAALSRERPFEQLSLHRLSGPAVAEMVSALLTTDDRRPTTDHGRTPKARRAAPASPSNPLTISASHSDLVSLLYQETEGNPFFIEEVLKHLVEEGAIYREQNGWRIKPLGGFSVPQSIKVTIGRRLQRLSEESRESLGLAAVMGQQFSFDVLLKASELEEERLLEITEEWLGAHLVVEQRVGRQEVYRFQHALIRAVAYEALSLRRRARLHERVGLALEAVYSGALEEHMDELASHFAQARSGAAVEKGVDYCLRAGERARSLYANEEAIRHLSAALELLDGLPADEPHLWKRWEVVFSLRKAYYDCRAFERAQGVLQEYLALAQRAGYPWGMAAAHYWMARTLAWSHSLARVLAPESARLREEHLDKSLQIARQHRLTDWRARAQVQLAQELYYTAVGEDLPRAEALLHGTLQAPDGIPKEVVQVAYLRLVQLRLLQGKWDGAAAALRQSIPFGGPSSLALCLAAMEDAFNRAGKHAEFIAICEEAKTLYAQAGIPLMLNQWYLEPTARSEAFRRLLFRDDFDSPELGPRWQWHDPAQVSAYSLSERPGHLTLRASLGVDLYPPDNLNAPRMLVEVRGDFVLETKMQGDWDERTDERWGGLLVWKDVLNYVRFDKSSRNRWQYGDVYLAARVAGVYDFFGRGQLRGDTYWLRLERTGDRIAALCSTDGVHWLTCGRVVLPAKDPLLVGVAALEGMVVHFDTVRLWGKKCVE